MNIVNLFYPREKIAGLAISDSSLRLLRAEGANSSRRLVVQTGVRLDPEVLDHGMVKNKAALVASLKTLKKKAGGRLETAPSVIVALPSQIVYSQFFQFPHLTSEQIKEAMELNVSTTLPFSASDAYLDWQEQTEMKIDSRLYKEVLFEAVRREAADGYIEALREAGFVPLVFESPALSLARVIDNFENEPGLAVYLNEEGALLLVKEGPFIRFSHFEEWVVHAADHGALSLTQEFMRAVLVKQTKLALNFYQSEHPDAPLKKFVLLAPPALKRALAEPLSEALALAHEESRGTHALKIDDMWLVALGTALRGFIPRDKDTFNSLMPIGTEEVYSKRKLVSYVSLWSDILTVLSLAALFIFLGTHFFLGYLLSGVNAQLETRGVITGPLTLGELEQRAKALNEKLAIMVPAAEQSNALSPIMNRMLALVPPGINLTHMGMTSLSQPINVTGTASSRDAALLFKNKLESSPDFIDVNLPLGSLAQIQNIVFTISFKAR